MRQPRRCRKVLTNLTHTVLAEGVSLITTPADDGVEVLAGERLPYRKALELAMSGAIMQAAHVASLILGLRAAGKIELRARFRLALNSPTSARGRKRTSAPVSKSACCWGLSRRSRPAPTDHSKRSFPSFATSFWSTASGE